MLRPDFPTISQSLFGIKCSCLAEAVEEALESKYDGLKSFMAAIDFNFSMFPQARPVVYTVFYSSSCSLICLFPLCLSDVFF